ncbi:MAG TPA: YciI family protein [Opitutus sp.]|nr:YciI family protein [Opitutus sp.]
MDPTTAATPYLLLFRNTGPENYAGLQADQREQLIARWNSWFEGLASQGKVIDGRPLKDRARVVSGAAGGRVVDGPFAETKEAVGGYAIVLAHSYEEATAIARQHPGLERGMHIEVREMADRCHLGILARGAGSSRS